MMEAHEKGIEFDDLMHERAIGAAIMAYHDTTNDPEGEMDMGKAIKAYLDASGMVLVPREPTKAMSLAASNEELRQQSCVPGMSAEDKLEYEDAYIAMISAAPNPFHKQEEGK